MSRATFTWNRPQNLIAKLLQVTGEVAKIPCSSRCKKSRGIWAESVVALERDAHLTGGACTDCYFNSQASHCSFYSELPNILLCLLTD